MTLTDLEFVRLTPGYGIKTFDCGDSDLNDFLLNDSCPQLGQLFSVTYLLEKDNKTVAFFTLVNDKIKLEDSRSKNFWTTKLGKKIPHNKRRKDYPAVKIGRLAVNNDYKGFGVGTAILDYIKIWFVEGNKTGCRFITVDAYTKSLAFYEKNGFNYLTDKDENDDTRLMYFDLIKIV